MGRCPYKECECWLARYSKDGGFRCLCRHFIPDGSCATEKVRCWYEEDLENG